MSKRQRDSQQRFAYAVRLFAEGSSGELPKEIQVIPTGKWNHPVYGEMEITPFDIAEMKRNFDDGVRLDLPITAGHDNGMNGGELPAVAWYKEVIDKGNDGLWAVPEWLSEGERLLRERSFKYFSSEFYSEYEDPQTGEKRKNVLVGGALTNRPYFKEMQPVGAFSEAGIMSQTFNDDMELEKILAKKPEELTAEEKAFVKQNEAQLTDEQKTAFATVIDEKPAETPEEKTAREKRETEAANIAAGLNPDGSPKVTASEKGKVVTMSEATFAALKTAADQGATALQKIEASERKALITKLTFSQSSPVGFYPKQAETLETFLKSLSETQRTAFTSLIEGMPKADAKLFSEIGDQGKEHDGSVESIYAQIKTFADAKISASNGKLSFSEAIKQVYAEKPELKQAYEAALAKQGA